MNVRSGANALVSCFIYCPLLEEEKKHVYLFLWTETCLSFSYQPAISQCDVSNKTLLDNIQLDYGEDGRIYYQHMSVPKLLFSDPVFQTIANGYYSKKLIDDLGITWEDDDYATYECQKTTQTFPAGYR